jgi:predicted PhzF superfamily epimerase YddE/YHI9
MPKTMPCRFATVDVFTTTPSSGNTLIVVLDAEGLSTAQMQVGVQRCSILSLRSA